MEIATQASSFEKAFIHYVLHEQMKNVNVGENVNVDDAAKLALSQARIGLQKQDTTSAESHVGLLIDSLMDSESFVIDSLMDEVSASIVEPPASTESESAAVSTAVSTYSQIVKNSNNLLHSFPQLQGMSEKEVSEVRKANMKILNLNVDNDECLKLKKILWLLCLATATYDQDLRQVMDTGKDQYVWISSTVRFCRDLTFQHPLRYVTSANFMVYGRDVKPSVQHQKACTEVSKKKNILHYLSGQESTSLYKNVWMNLFHVNQPPVDVPPSTTYSYVHGYTGGEPDSPLHKRSSTYLGLIMYSGDLSFIPPGFFISYPFKNVRLYARALSNLVNGALPNVCEAVKLVVAAISKDFKGEISFLSAVRMLGAGLGTFAEFQLMYRCLWNTIQVQNN